MLNGNTKKFEVFDASSYTVAIVRACFNEDLTQLMLEETLKTLKEYNISDQKISLFEVPGCVEIPVILEALAQTEKYDAVVALGCVIKGNTPHFEYVCKIVSEGILQVSLENTLPIGFGISTVNTPEQGVERISIGRDAVVAALQSAKIVNEL